MYSPWGRKESDTNEQLSLYLLLARGLAGARESDGIFVGATEVEIEGTAMRIAGTVAHIVFNFSAFSAIQVIIRS